MPTDRKNQKVTRKSLPKKKILVGFFAVVVMVFVLAFSNVLPDKKLSTLDKVFPAGSSLEEVVTYLLEVDFRTKEYEFNIEGFRNKTGGVTVSPLIHHHHARDQFHQICPETGCSVLDSIKDDNFNVLGTKWFHRYSYLWIFKDGELIAGVNDSGYWIWPK